MCSIIFVCLLTIQPWKQISLNDFYKAWLLFEVLPFAIHGSNPPTLSHSNVNIPLFFTSQNSLPAVAITGIFKGMLWNKNSTFLQVKLKMTSPLSKTQITWTFLRNSIKQSSSSNASRLYCFISVNPTHVGYKKI